MPTDRRGRWRSRSFRGDPALTCSSASVCQHPGLILPRFQLRFLPIVSLLSPPNGSEGIKAGIQMSHFAEMKGEVTELCREWTALPIVLRFCIHISENKSNHV